MSEMHQLHALRVKQLYSNAFIGIIASLINALILVIISVKLISVTVLIVWFSAVLAISIFRVLISIRYLRSSRTSANSHRWEKLFTASMALSGVIWGSAAIFLFPIDSVPHQIFMAFVLGGMVAGAVGAYSVVLTTFLAFSLPALLPIIIRFFLLAGSIHLTMGSMVLLGGILMIITAKRMNAITITSFKLQFEKDDLVRHLSAEKERIEKLNQDYLSEINDRKQAENALMKSEARLNTIIQKAPVMIDAFDDKGMVSLWNEECVKRLGWTRDEINANDDIMGTFYPDPSERKRVFDCLERADGKFREYTVQAKDGSRLKQMWADFRLPDGDLISMGVDVTKRKKAENQLKASLNEKEVLLRELYHRTRNNMNVISGLITLQSQNINDPQVLEIFRETNNRIMSMGLVHQLLYQSQDLYQIDLKDYLEKLSNALHKSYQVSSERVYLKLDLESVLVSIETAAPCGLIVNEMISNGLKYAFPDNRSGEIRITLHKTGEDEIELRVGDNGIGIPEEIDFRNTESLGMQLIVDLVEQQLDGTVELNRDRGTEFIIRLREL